MGVNTRDARFSVVASNGVVVDHGVPVKNERVGRSVYDRVQGRCGLRVKAQATGHLGMIVKELGSRGGRTQGMIKVSDVSKLPQRRIVSTCIIGRKVTGYIGRVTTRVGSFLRHAPPRVTCRVTGRNVCLANNDAQLPCVSGCLTDCAKFTFGLSSLCRASTTCNLRGVVHSEGLHG